MLQQELHTGHKSGCRSFRRCGCTPYPPPSTPSAMETIDSLPPSAQIGSEIGAFNRYQLFSMIVICFVFFLPLTPTHPPRLPRSHSSRGEGRGKGEGGGGIPEFLRASFRFTCSVRILRRFGTGCDVTFPRIRHWSLVQVVGRKVLPSTGRFLLTDFRVSWRPFNPPSLPPCLRPPQSFLSFIPVIGKSLVPDDSHDHISSDLMGLIG